MKKAKIRNNFKQEALKNAANLAKPIELHLQGTVLAVTAEEHDKSFHGGISVQDVAQVRATPNRCPTLSLYAGLPDCRIARPPELNAIS